MHREMLLLLCEYSWILCKERQFLCMLFFAATVAAVSLAKFAECSVVFGFIKSGPVGGGDVILGVGSLPNQEVAGAKLAAGADD